MITVTKRNLEESSESLIRRFSRRMIQSGIIMEAKSRKEQPRHISKNMRREAALVGRKYSLARAERIKFGGK